ALLPGRVGEARAAEWILTGRVFSGREAAEAGFASRAGPRGSLSPETESLAARGLSAAPAPLAPPRGALPGSRRQAPRSRLPAAETAYRALAGDADLSRAVREFGLSKRR